MICGFGRIGSLVGTALETFVVPYVVVELDPEIIKASVDVVCPAF